MPHRRSVQSKLRRLSRQLVLKTAFQDPVWAETVCRTDKTEVNYHIIATLTVEDSLYIRRILSLDDDETIQNGHVDRILHLDEQSHHVDAENGLVLTDSRGRGAFQK